MSATNPHQSKSLEPLPPWAMERFDFATLDFLDDAASEDLRKMFTAKHLAKLDAIEALNNAVSETRPADEIQTLLYRFGSNARLQWLVAHHHQLTTQVLQGLLPQAWIDPNLAIGGPKGFTNEIALAMFHRTGYLSDTGQPKPTKPTQIFHGVVFPTVNGEPCRQMWDGMAWTTSLEVATRFANHGLWTASAPPQHVLACFNSRDEAEIVIDPADVDGLTQLET